MQNVQVWIHRQDREDPENKNKDKRSACKQQIELNPTHEWDYDDVEILDSMENDTKLRIKELLFILTRKPKFNKQHSINSLSKYETKTLLIKTYPEFRPEDDEF